MWEGERGEERVYSLRAIDAIASPSRGITKLRPLDTLFLRSASCKTSRNESFVGCTISSAYTFGVQWSLLGTHFLFVDAPCEREIGDPMWIGLLIFYEIFRHNETFRTRTPSLYLRTWGLSFMWELIEGGRGGDERCFRFLTFWRRFLMTIDVLRCLLWSVTWHFSWANKDSGRALKTFAWFVHYLLKILRKYWDARY